MTQFAILASTVLLFLAAAPLNASAGGAVPEPSDLALFALGLVGVVIGRKAAMRRRPDESGDKAA